MTGGPPTPSAVLTVRDLKITFPGRTIPAVESVDLDLRAGRVLGLVGQSGSGKSLTATSVLGLLPTAATVQGSIRFEGGELLGARPADLRALRGRKIGAVFQEPLTAFDPLHTVGEQIAEAVGAHTSKRPASSVRARVVELLAAVGLREPRIARAFPHQLSGGQLQRAMIAIAISNDPVILIADEPTTNLDSVAQAGILHLLGTLAAERGMAVLLITHNMGVVSALADDVIVLREGRIVESGATRHILRQPTNPYTRDLLAAVPTLAPTTRAPTEKVLRSDAIGELDRATVIYGSRRRRRTVLDGLTLRIGEGEVVGLVGESGAGKSTVGRALAGVVPLVEGRASIAGVDLGRADRRERRSARARIGYVSQHPTSALNPTASVGWSVAEPLMLHTHLLSAQRSARVAELLDAVQLPADFAGRHPHELSGGERQRVSIARALALEPSLIIADEPTSALDTSTQAGVVDLLAGLQRRLGFACLVISHDLALVQRLSDTVVVLRAGREVERGPAGILLSGATDPYTRQLIDAVPNMDPGPWAHNRGQRSAATEHA